MIIQFRSNPYQLTGVFSQPADSSILAIILNGSGKLDRDGNQGKLKLGISSQISHHLYEQGIASFCFDKRGINKSEGNFVQTTFEDHIQDALAAIEHMKKAYPYMKLILIGHSEGAIIATRIAAKRNDFIGVVLLSGIASNFREVLEWQREKVINSLQGVGKWLLKILPINPAKMQAKFIDKIENSDKNVIRLFGLKKFNAGWLRQILAYNPGDDIAHINCPILAITGEKDLQVPPHDLDKMKALATVPIECHEQKNLTHLLRTDKGPASISHYKALIKQPIDRQMLCMVSNWVRRLFL